MKADLDRLMQERGLAGLLVAGGEEHSVARAYLSAGVHISGGLIVKKPGAEPLLIVNGMEFEEAKKSGLPCKTYGDVGYMDIVRQTSDPVQQTLLFWRAGLRAAGIEGGRIGVYGTGEINVYLEIARQAAAALPEYEIVGEAGPTLLAEAMMTKDADEIARIRDVARRTNEVLQATWDYIAGHQAQADETLADDQGAPLTIGDVKRFVRRALLDRGLEDTGMIFAQGSDAGWPHSRGEEAMVLRQGQSIVFDLFPRELGGGYCHDVTRTWCIGYAPPEVQQAYDQVMEAFDRSLEAFALGQGTYTLQEVVLDYFEGQGHRTQRSHPGGLEGYVHSLGHGIGLQIHERPGISHLRRDDVFQVGQVITIEPGLYYPERGFGVRVEDSLFISEAGELVSITPFRKDLVLPLRKD